MRELEVLGTSSSLLALMTASKEFEVKTVICVSNIKDSMANAKMEVMMLNGEILDVPEPVISDNLLCAKDGIFMRGQDIANCIQESQSELSQLESYQAATASAAVSESIQNDEPHFTLDDVPLPPHLGVHGGNYQVSMQAGERDSEGKVVKYVSYGFGIYRKLEDT